MDKLCENVLAYADVIKMCRGTEYEDIPWLGVRMIGFTVTPPGLSLGLKPNNNIRINKHPKFKRGPYRFARGIVNGKFVFEGDMIYFKDGLVPYEVGKSIINGKDYVLTDSVNVIDTCN